MQVLSHRLRGNTFNTGLSQFYLDFLHACTSPTFQYNAYMSVVHEMIEKVETEHRAKLEQLNSMQQ